MDIEKAAPDGAAFFVLNATGAAGVGAEGGEGIYVNPSLLFFGFEDDFFRIMYLQIPDYTVQF